MLQIKNNFFSPMQCVYGLIIWPWSFGGNAYCTTIKTSDNPFHMCGRIYICNNAQQPQPWYYGVKIIIRISPPQITHTIVYWTVSFIAFGIQYVLHEEGKLGFWILPETFGFQLDFFGFLLKICKGDFRCPSNGPEISDSEQNLNT